jgi:hypothetical protein
MRWIDWRRPLLAVVVAGLGPRQASAQDWSRFDEAANVVAQAHHELTLDTVLLERVRSGLQRSRALFPELRRIQAEGAGVVLYLPAYTLPDTVQRFIAAQAAERRERRRAWGRWMEIASTGSPTLDSLTRQFGAARVLIDVDSATGTPKSIGTIAIEYLRPMNVARIEAVYEAAGLSTYAPFRMIGPRDHSSVVWTSLPHSDLFHFRLEAGCNDPCRRHERYLVRVPRGPGPAEMLEREVRIDPDH